MTPLVCALIQVHQTAKTSPQYELWNEISYTADPPELVRAGLQLLAGSPTGSTCLLTGTGLFAFLLSEYARISGKTACCVTP